MTLDSREIRDPKDPFGLKRLDSPDFEAEERARLRPTHPTGVPTREVQAAFEEAIKNDTQHVELSGKLKFRTEAERLFYATQSQSSKGLRVRRQYLREPIDDSFNLYTDVLASLDLRRSPNGDYGVGIKKFGEFYTRNREMVGATFILDERSGASTVYQQISIAAQLEDKELSVSYRGTGSISTITFPSIGPYSVSISTPPNRSEVTLK